MNTEDRYTEAATQEQLFNYAANLMLGYLVQPELLLHGVRIRDIYTGSKGEELYNRLTEIFHSLSPEVKVWNQNNGDYAPELEEALTLVDDLMCWCMMEGLRTGNQIGQATHMTGETMPPVTKV